MEPVPGREGELGALAIIFVSVCAYLLLELEWRQLLTRSVSRSCQARRQGGVCLLVHAHRHLQCTCTMLLCHILSVAAVWTGVCGVGQFCVIPVLSNKKCTHVPFSCRVSIKVRRVHLVRRNVCVMVGLGLGLWLETKEDKRTVI